MHGPEYLPRSASCFVCGRDNHHGLRVRFVHEDGEVVVRAKLARDQEGFPHVVHGGVQAALLDEAMGWAVACEVGHFVVTANLELRYGRQIQTETDLVIRARFLETVRGKLHKAEATIETPDGTRLTRGRGSFAALDPEYVAGVRGILLDEPDVPELDWLPPTTE